jgi:predicted aspartyl protease
MEPGANGFGGSAMMRGRGQCWGLVVFCALLSAGPATAEDPKDCKLRVVMSSELQTIPDGRVAIPVQLEGHDYRLMVDTGGYINTVSPQVVAQEGYHPRDSQGLVLRGMGTTKLDSYVTVKDFAIGRSHGKNFEFFIDDFSSSFADGTLAPQVLAVYDVDLDFVHGKFNLISPDHCAGGGVYWADSAATVPIEIKDRTHIRIPVTINGKEIMATVDTGATTSYITMRAARRFLDINDKDPALKLRGNISVNGMVGPVYNYPFQSLSFGAVTVNHPRIEMVADKVWNEDDLLLGIGILRQLHIYIAYKERKMYITPALVN